MNKYYAKNLDSGNVKEISKKSFGELQDKYSAACKQHGTKVADAIMTIIPSTPEEFELSQPKKQGRPKASK